MENTPTLLFIPLKSIYLLIKFYRNLKKNFLKIGLDPRNTFLTWYFFCSLQKITFSDGPKLGSGAFFQEDIGVMADFTKV